MLNMTYLTGRHQGWRGPEGLEVSAAELRGENGLRMQVDEAARCRVQEGGRRLAGSMRGWLDMQRDYPLCHGPSLGWGKEWHDQIREGMRAEWRLTCKIHIYAEDFRTEEDDKTSILEARDDAFRRPTTGRSHWLQQLQVPQATSANFRQEG